MTGLIGFETRFSIAKSIQEIASPPASIVDHTNDNNAPFRRLEQPRDVMISDARGATVGKTYVRVRCAPRFRCPCPLPRAQRRYSPEIFNIESPLSFATSRSPETDVSFKVSIRNTSKAKHWIRNYLLIQPEICR